MDKEDKDYEEENNGSESKGDEPQHQRNPHKGGRIIRHKPSNISELEASPMNVSFFNHLGFYEFYEHVQRVQYHPMLTRIFVANLHDNKVTLFGVTFTVSSSIIVDATSILNVGGEWYKAQDLGEHYHKPYNKSRYRNENKRTFPFRFLQDKYFPNYTPIILGFLCTLEE